MTREDIIKKQEMLQNRIANIDYNITGLVEQKDKLIDEDLRLQRLLEALQEQGPVE